MKYIRTCIIVTILSIAMGFLECAVVIYMREILYPGGFEFPLAAIEGDLALTEILREAATMVMLLAIGLMAGRNGSERFAWFLYSFAVWDIFYYVFLKILIGWPSSLLTWDILFLIPVTWVGPVIAPLILSLTMIAFAMIVIFFSGRNGKARISTLSWSLLIAGSLVLILSFTWDYSGFMLDHYSFSEIWTIPRENLYDLAASYIPRKFSWWIFLPGEGIILAGILCFYVQNHRTGST